MLKGWRLTRFRHWGMKYKLLKAQKEFLRIPHDYKLDVAVYQGGYGSGKTFAGSLLGLSLCFKYPGIRGLVGAQTFPLVRDTTLINYFEHLDRLKLQKGVHYDFCKTETRLIIFNKDNQPTSEILFRSFDDESRLKSLNLGFVEIEEMSDISEAAFNMLLGRLRQSDIPRYRLFGHTNPECSKGWIYKNFIENPKPNYRLIIAPTTENIFLPEHFVEDLKNAYDPEYYEINVLGNFGNYSRGLVTKGFEKDNLCEINYCPDMPLHISCDFNVDPMCWLLAHKTDDKVFFFDEIVLENTTTALTVQEFYSRYMFHKAPVIINGDASGDYRSVSSELTNYITMRNQLKNLGFSVEIKIRPFNPQIKSRIAAWNAKMRNAKGETSIFVSPKCKWLLYNIHNLKYKEGSSLLELPSHYQVKSDRQAKFLGHPFDAASYIVEYYWPVILQ